MLRQIQARALWWTAQDTSEYLPRLLDYYENKDSSPEIEAACYLLKDSATSDEDIDPFVRLRLFSLITDACLNAISRKTNATAPRNRFYKA